MEMRKYGMSAMALLGALLLGNGQAQASETVWNGAIGQPTQAMRRARKGRAASGQ